ncbi:hypothetical protein A3K73_01335 [Candidatus Pacearchaeota archaeon RBG_13_36_9]|nr:MAG: hypothetical protein A3K73_01335 [Candidatus Pacearchaeota archaeon RBG_13_36_9]
MNLFQSTLQIGKNGLTPGFFEELKMHFKKRSSVKVVLLKSAGHDKEKTKEIAEKIMMELGKNYTYKIVGFTIFLKKWRKEKGL